MKHCNWAFSVMRIPNRPPVTPEEPPVAPEPGVAVEVAPP